MVTRTLRAGASLLAALLAGAALAVAGAAPASAVAWTGTVGIPADTAPDAVHETVFTDSHPLAIEDIPGIEFEVFFATERLTPFAATVSSDYEYPSEHSQPWKPDLVTSSLLASPVRYDATTAPAALVLRSAGGERFSLTSFVSMAPHDYEAVYTVTGYRGGSALPGASQQYELYTERPTTIALSTAFLDVDEVRVTTDGGYRGGPVIEQFVSEGFNNFAVQARPQQTDLELNALSLSQTTLEPAFTPGTTSYTATVPASVTRTTVRAEASDRSSGVTANGIYVPAGYPSGAIGLAPGSTTITVVVTAADGRTQDYTIAVTRSQASGNATLSALALSAGTLSPPFHPHTTQYTASVAHHVTALAVTPTVEHEWARVAVNGAAVASGTPSELIPLEVGPNTVTKVVTAEDGTSTSYTVVIMREAPPAAPAATGAGGELAATGPDAATPTVLALLLMAAGAAIAASRTARRA